MRRIFILLTALLTAFALALPVGAGAREKSSMHDFETGEEIRGFTSLKRNADDVDVSVHLRELTPGNAYTLWGVYFNNPDGCSDGVCGEDDLFNPDANTSVAWAGFGGVANGGGNLDGNVTIGEGLAGAPGQVLFGNGLVDSGATEIHFVVQDHGPASNDPAVLEAQTTTFGGGCPPNTCVDIQFSIHK